MCVVVNGYEMRASVCARDGWWKRQELNKARLGKMRSDREMAG
jgi:hypothetical protein